MHISLEWKEFSVNLDKINIHFKASLSSNYDGLVCDENTILVMFKETIEEADSDIVTQYWDNIIAANFLPTLNEIVTGKINEASIFGNSVIAQAIVENVLMGITQAGKTKQIADLFNSLQYYLKTGSLYAAITEIERIISDDLDPTLSPFVTEERLNSYKIKIEEYING